MRNQLVFVALLFFSIKGFSGTLESKGEVLHKVSLSGIEIPVYEKVDLKLGAKNSASLKLTGGGVREKKVLITSVNVYFIQSYTDLTSPLDAADPLKSLTQAKARALRMTFLREIEAEKIRTSFSDALKENGVSLEDPAIQAILSNLKFDVKKGGSVDIIGTKTDSGAEKLQLIFPERTVLAESQTLVTDFWKIWFGKPADGGLEDLKPRLLSLDQLMHL